MAARRSGEMSMPNKRQLAIHTDKWVVTVREGKDLVRVQQRDSFFTKMSPVCELSLGDQGPFSTSVKTNTTQPSWDESLEFEAYPSSPTPPKGEEDDGGGGGGGGRGLPQVGPKLGGSQVPAGSVRVEYMLVPGIPPLPNTPAREQQQPEGVGGAVLPAAVDERVPPSPALLLAAVAGATLAVLLSTCLKDLLLGLGSSIPPLVPIPVPFKIAAGKHKGSSTHHIRLQAEDGNVVVATGPKPPPSPPLPPPPSNTGGEKAASDTATLLWQSGPIRSLERSANPSDRTCKKCQLKVGRDGRVVVARGKEELAVFSSSSVRKLKAFFLVEGGD
eukprot:jgi/Undpi1/14057/HiC_scaffold_9.g03708.m1